MSEKDVEHTLSSGEKAEETGNPRAMANSTTEPEAESDRETAHEKSDEPGSTLDEKVKGAVPDDRDSDADIDHDEVEAAVPGHELDLELGRVSVFTSSSHRHISVPHAMAAPPFIFVLLFLFFWGCHFIFFCCHDILPLLHAGRNWLTTSYRHTA